MAKRGLDQTSAWLLAVIFAGGAFGGLHFITKYIAHRIDASEGSTEHAGMEHDQNAEHGDGHERPDVEATDHGETSQEAKKASKNHGSDEKVRSDEHSP